MTDQKTYRTVASDPAMGRARLMVERLGVQMKLRRAEVDAGAGVGDGARPTPGPARPRVVLAEVVEELGDRKQKRHTPLGMQTARMRLPRVLHALPDGDARRLVALRYVTLVELINAPTVCADLNSTGGGRGRVSDGGAVHRAGMAEEYRGYERAIGCGVALSPMTRRGMRGVITDRALVDMVCLGQMELRAVLRSYGWSARAAFVAHLTERFLGALERMADAPAWRAKGD